MLKFKGKAKDFPKFLERLKEIHKSKSTMKSICGFINELLGDIKNVSM